MTTEPAVVPCRRRAIWAERARISRDFDVVADPPPAPAQIDPPATKKRKRHHQPRTVPMNHR